MAVKIPMGKARIGDAGRLSESRLANSIGARLRPASGAVDGMKGDMELERFLIEAKSTTGDSLSLKHAVLSKIVKEAREKLKKPAVAINFTTGDGRPVPNGQWIAIRLSDFMEMAFADKESEG